MKTKTEQALELIKHGMTVRQAARKVDISESAVHAAVKKRKAQVECPCCGSMVEKLLVPASVVPQLEKIRAKYPV